MLLQFLICEVNAELLKTAYNDMKKSSYKNSQAIQK